MLKELTADEINRRRKGFAYFPFCAGVIILGIVAVPVASVYLRTWKPLLYWIPCLIFISILPLETGSIFFAGILINAVYSYITVKRINNSVLYNHSISELKPSTNQDNDKESNDLEKTILDILEEHNSLAFGRICAYSDHPYENVKAKLEYLKKAGVIEEKITKSDTIEYSLI
tara:strand:- start:2110 stop:2628 length:519 start_codon:yes stop_codon:yes gene_type:complete